MPVDRLSRVALKKILGGQLKEEVTCVIKFYSNECPLCHNLKEYYEELAENPDYAGLHFFAFNIGDYPQVEKQLQFYGVPTISLVKTGGRSPKIRVLGDPEAPNEKTWYRVKDIKDFIDKEK
jgi:thiol-disulfide isomerase/thioredoxin